MRIILLNFINSVHSQDFTIILFILLLFLISRLAKQFWGIKIKVWIWIIFILMMIKSCSLTSKRNQNKSQIRRTYNNVWNGKVNDEIENFIVNLIFDSTGVKILQYQTVGWQIMYSLENNPISKENIADNNLQTPEIDFKISEYHKKYLLGFIPLASENIDIEGNCNSKTGQCFLKINGKVFDINCKRNESIDYHFYPQ